MYDSSSIKQARDEQSFLLVSPLLLIYCLLRPRSYPFYSLSPPSPSLLPIPLYPPSLLYNTRLLLTLSEKAHYILELVIDFNGLSDMDLFSSLTWSFKLVLFLKLISLVGHFFLEFLPQKWLIFLPSYGSSCCPQMFNSVPSRSSVYQEKAHIHSRNAFLIKELVCLPSNL